MLRKRGVVRLVAALVLVAVVWVAFQVRTACLVVRKLVRACLMKM